MFENHALEQEETILDRQIEESYAVLEFTRADNRNLQSYLWRAKLCLCLLVLTLLTLFCLESDLTDVYMPTKSNANITQWLEGRNLAKTQYLLWLLLM